MDIIRVIAIKMVLKHIMQRILYHGIVEPVHIIISPWRSKHYNLLFWDFAKGRKQIVAWP